MRLVGKHEQTQYCMHFSTCNMNAYESYAFKRAVQKADLVAIKALVAQGADIHEDADYALRYSAENGHLSIVKYLVEKGAYIRMKNDYALLYSARNGHLEVVEFLVERVLIFTP